MDEVRWRRKLLKLIGHLHLHNHPVRDNPKENIAFVLRMLTVPLNNCVCSFHPLDDGDDDDDDDVDGVMNSDYRMSLPFDGFVDRKRRNTSSIIRKIPLEIVDWLKYIKRRST